MHVGAILNPWLSVGMFGKLIVIKVGIKLCLSVLWNAGLWQVISEKNSNKWCQVDVHWQQHKLSNFFIFVSAASFPYQRERPIHFTNGRWSEGKTKLACTSVIAQSSPSPKSLQMTLFFFFCKNNCAPAFQNTKAGFAFVHKMWFGEFGDHAATYLHNQMANCTLF